MGLNVALQSIAVAKKITLMLPGSLNLAGKTGTPAYEEFPIPLFIKNPGVQKFINLSLNRACTINLEHANFLQ